MELLELEELCRRGTAGNHGSRMEPNVHDAGVAHMPHIRELVDNPRRCGGWHRPARHVVAVVVRTGWTVVTRHLGAATIAEQPGRMAAREPLGESTVAAIDPDRQAAVVARRGDQVELPVAVEVDGREPDDGKVGVKLPPLAGGQADDDVGRPEAGVHPVVNAVTIEIREEHLRGGRRGRKGHEGRNGQQTQEESDAAHVVNYTVAIPGCHEFVEIDP